MVTLGIYSRDPESPAQSNLLLFQDNTPSSTLAIRGSFLTVERHSNSLKTLVILYSLPFALSSSSVLGESTVRFLQPARHPKYHDVENMVYGMFVDVDYQSSCTDRLITETTTAKRCKCWGYRSEEKEGDSSSTTGSERCATSKIVRCSFSLKKIRSSRTWRDAWKDYEDVLS